MKPEQRALFMCVVAFILNAVSALNENLPWFLQLLNIVLMVALGVVMHNLINLMKE